MNYPIFFTDAVSAALDDFISKGNYSQIICLTDTHTREFCLSLLESLSCEHTTIPFGEEHKNIETCASIWSAMTEKKLDRKALMINLGGGVIGDMGGFCASTYKRGIGFVQIPTTLLSQVDASVGGKLGIDFQTYKNQIGVFCDPKAVLIDPIFLRTLPHKELIAGFAEVLKHGLIRDKAYWEKLQTISIKDTDWLPIIQHSVQIKEKIVTEDPYEKGLRKILNFGHTVGHAIESFYLQKSDREHLLHGEAIAIGMICESYISYLHSNLSSEDLYQIAALILSHFLKVEINVSDYKAIIELCYQDKKNEHRKINGIELEGIGKASYDHIWSETELMQSLEFYATL